MSDPGESPSRRIAEHFRARILSGDLRQGERLPSTREMAAEWQVAAKTAVSFARSMGPGCCHDLGTTLRLLEHLGVADRFRQAGVMTGRCRRR